METKYVRLRVPGTSANCGPGFDCLGVACTIYNELEFALLEEKKLDIQITGKGAENIPLDGRNIVWRSAQAVLKKLKLEKKYQGAIIRMENQVPLSRGLGSSATAIVGGLAAANEWLGRPLSKEEILELATEIEGHPDNVAPAIYGGFTVSIVEANKPISMHFVPDMPLKLVVAIPDFFLATKAARGVLPKELPMQDAVYNIGRAAMLTAALSQNRSDLLPYVFDDKLHQPYRAELIPGMYEVFTAAKNAGALGVSMSGAGPCLIAFTLDNMDEIGKAMQIEFKKHNIKSEYIILDIDVQGATAI